MIKLVATDMDGTLLNSQSELSPRFFPVLEKLREKGVRFAVASGRQYYNLLGRFESVKNWITFISENGAMVYDRGKSLWVSELPYLKIQEVIETIRKTSNILPVLCGEQGAYVEHDHPFFMENARMYFTRLRRVDDVMAMARQDRICKIAAFDLDDAERSAYPLLQAFEGPVHACLSGSHWVDVMNPKVNKGEAIRVFQHKYNITPDECMAFGDYLNDYEMLQVCGESYAMANAHPKLKGISRHIAKSNDEDGVVDALCSAFGIDI